MELFLSQKLINEQYTDTCAFMRKTLTQNSRLAQYAISVYSPLFFRGGGGTYSPSLNFKTHCFTYCGGSQVPVGIFLLYLCLSSSLSKSQIIFVLFVVISSDLCCCFKAVLLVRILLYPSRASQWKSDSGRTPI